MSYLTNHDKLLVISNWFRKLGDSNIRIDDICKIILQFAKVYEHFDAYDKEGVEITGNGSIATALRFTDTSFPIYCKRIIPYKTKQIFTWKFKCLHTVSNKYWGIGFDAMENAPIYNEYFHNKSGRNNYLYKPNGDIWKSGNPIGDQRTSGWKQGDMIILIYNGAARELSISVNGERDHNSSLNVNESVRGFRAVLVLSYQKDKAELLQ